jgi:hypothetical protein
MQQGYIKFEVLLHIINKVYISSFMFSKNNLKAYAKAYLTIIICCSVISSCRPVIYLVYGVKKPKPEEEKSISNVLQSVHIGRYPLVVSTYDGFFNNFSFGSSDINVFDKEGRLIIMPENACSYNRVTFLKNLNKQEKFKRSDSAVIDSVSKTWLLPNGEPFVYRRSDTADYTVVIKWCRWMGKKLLKQQVVQGLQAMQQNTGVRFAVILLNMDIQKLWGEDKLATIKTTKTSIAFNDR